MAAVSEEFTGSLGSAKQIEFTFRVVCFEGRRAHYHLQQWSTAGRATQAAPRFEAVVASFREQTGGSGIMPVPAVTESPAEVPGVYPLP
jgi:hypothetical protein